MPNSEWADDRGVRHSSARRPRREERLKKGGKAEKDGKRRFIDTLSACPSRAVPVSVPDFCNLLELAVCYGTALLTVYPVRQTALLLSAFRSCVSVRPAVSERGQHP